MSSTSKAKSASGAAMVPPPETIPLDHGGDLDAARKLFPGAPEPFLDLSTAINPHRYPYPIRELLPEDFARLPAPEDLKQLRDRAATFYAVPSPDNVVAGPGGQALMALAARLVPAGHATIVAPTYADFLAGREGDVG